MSEASTQARVGSVVEPAIALDGVAAVEGAPAAVRQPSARATGYAYALAAYVSWALLPIYFKHVFKVASALEALAHRIIWGVPALALLLWWRGRLGAAAAAFRDPRSRRTLLATTTLIAFNWYLFVWAVGNGRVMESSLGYFMNPLVNVVFGVAILKERLTRGQVVGLGLAVVGVGVYVVSAGVLPWVSIALAVSFGCYALLRKRAAVDALPGLMVETTLLAPFAVVYMAWLMARGDSGLERGDWVSDALLISAGLVTVLPLLWFTEGARRLPLVTMGFLQYISPSGQFLLATLVYGEAFTPARAAMFACIWAGLAVCSVEAALRARRGRASGGGRGRRQPA